MCQIVLDYYGIKKATKANKFLCMQLSPINTTDATLKTQIEIGEC